MAGLRVSRAKVRSILTRTSGYLSDVCSHSLQPYRGCSFGRSLCGVGCYVQHNRFVTRGEAWGGFVEARTNASDVYAQQAERERRWARRVHGSFSIFMSSATDPFLPHESRFGITRSVLEAMLEAPPDALVVQTHGDGVLRERERLVALAQRCALRVHVSVESDRDGLPGLPPPACSVARRLAAARALREAGLRTVITVSPLLPIGAPHAFFSRVGECADAVVIDHFVEGDGSPEGARTLRTRLPSAMERVDRGSTRLAYRDEMVALARSLLPGRVGVSRDGFAGRMLPPS
jgi:DNA repair photolyase